MNAGLLDGKWLYPTTGHPDGSSGAPWFRIRGDLLYPTASHPDGSSGVTWFQIR